MGSAQNGPPVDAPSRGCRVAALDDFRVACGVVDELADGGLRPVLRRWRRRLASRLERHDSAWRIVASAAGEGPVAFVDGLGRRQ
jgi:hypothetical protein